MEYLIVEYTGIEERIRFFIDDIKAEWGTREFEEAIEEYDTNNNTVIVVPLNEHTRKQIQDLAEKTKE